MTLNVTPEMARGALFWLREAEGNLGRAEYLIGVQLRALGPYTCRTLSAQQDVIRKLQVSARKGTLATRIAWLEELASKCAEKRE